MQIILGPFHPQLEDAFVEAIQRFKASDSLKPLLIVVPSDSLRRYLMKHLTLKHGLNLINVSLLNFNQLSNKLYEETQLAAGLRLHDDFFFEEMLHLLLQRPGSDFSELKDSDGGTSALWQTLRDLKEGLLDPYIALQALKEGHFGKTAIQGRLPRLFSLYRQLKQACDEQQIFDYGEISRRATDAVADSPFLKSFAGIFYYGFYDLTQVLIDLLHEVAKFHPTTLFFPLIPGACAWGFAERFFERHVEGQKSSIKDLTKNISPALLFPHAALFEELGPPAVLSVPKKTDCKVISTYDLRDEVLTVAKEILRLRADEGLAFDEIGIVARDLTHYLSPIQDIFHKHAIPIVSTCEIPLIQFPRIQSVFLMTTLLLQDFPRVSCIDLMTAPFFKHPVCGKVELSPKPEHWDFLSRKAKITSGWDAWQKLELQGKEAHRDVSDQSTLLWATFSALYQDLSALPKEGAWSDYVQSWQRLLEKYLDFVPADKLKQGECETLSKTEQISKTLSNILERLASLGQIAGQVSRDDFIAAFQRGLKKVTIPFASDNIAGASVLNIMQARGLSFRVLFLLGMNEGHFPRAISEDPFLKDPQRRVLETVLGYKVGEKLAAYDEEKLLFTLTIGSAKEKCYALYHRTDELGAPSAPSWYLGELKRVFQMTDENEQIMPRILVEAPFVAPFNPVENLLPAEWAIRLCLKGEDLDPILKQLPFSPDLYRHSLKVLAQLESDGPLNTHDGLISESKTHWDTLLEKGISPTRLEAYALCPFQYYGKYFLKLSSEEDPEDEVLPKTHDIGTLCHEILKVFYEGWDFEDDSKAVFKNKDLTQRLALISEALFESYALKNPVFYPLPWEILKTTILVMLHEVIEADLDLLSDSGYRPAAFEVECRQKIVPEWPEFRGKMDRVDFNEEEGKARIVDYKITFRKAPLPLEKNLLTSALRGKKLQAPIYLRLAEIFAEARAGSESGQTSSVFYHIAPNWPDGPLIISEFPESGWQGECGDMLKETLSTLLQGIESGRFFMKPGDHCDFCDIRPLCRKNHFPSLKRLEEDPLWQQQQAIQKLKPPKSCKKKKEKPA